VSGSAMRDGRVGNRPEPRGQAGQVRQYELGEMRQLTQRELNALRGVGERVARHLEQSLRAFLGCTAECSLTSVREGRYADFLALLPDRTIIAEIACPPVAPPGAWEVSLTVIYAIIERMMGWQGPTSPPRRDPSGPELALVGTVMQRMTAWFGQACGEALETAPQFRRVLMPPAHIALIAEAQPVVMMLMDMGIADASGAARICLPRELVAPARQRVRGARASTRSHRLEDRSARDQVRSALGRAEVVVRAELGTGRIRLGQLLRLTPGDVVPLDRQVGELTDVLIGGRPRFRGVPGCRGRRLAVEIREVVGREQPKAEGA
jgi:flagellar motor switch protein FliM